jgi:hypothetical protein
MTFVIEESPIFVICGESHHFQKKGDLIILTIGSVAATKYHVFIRGESKPGANPTNFEFTVTTPALQKARPF